MGYEPRLLPIGIASIETMIQENFIYVDKTRYIHELIKSGKYYFLSRPRRFGKSLLLSTLEQIFLGNRQLFDPFFIATTNYDWQVYSVIHLSFSAFSTKTAQALEQDIAWKLGTIAKRYSVNISDAPSIKTKFGELIENLASKNKVVILVDEYDYPLLNNIHTIELAQECRDLLHEFFTALKDYGKYIHFVFITGITKFSKTSIFSGLNNLDDLTISRTAAQLLGYTAEELTYYFNSYLHTIADTYGLSLEKILKQIATWYNGYQFVEAIGQQKVVKVYNPFSVLAYLKEGRLFNYWFETGTPTFLVHLIKTQNYPISQIEGSEVNIDEMKAYEIDSVKLIPLLWQTGYLTIESYDTLTKNYKLTYPNEEVRTSFLHFFMSFITNTPISFIASYIVKLCQSLKQNDLSLFFQTLEVFFANIPYTMQLPQEKYYQSIVYVIMMLTGAYVHAEVATNEGRIDTTIETASHIYILEFKLRESAESALEQIKEKKYYQKYLQLGKKIVLVGVTFSMEKRTIGSWTAREYNELL